MTTSQPQELVCKWMPEENHETDDKAPLVRYSAAEAVADFRQQGIFSSFVGWLAKIAPSLVIGQLKKEIVTYADYKRFVDDAKKTRYGLTSIEVEGKKIVFIANPDVGRKMLGLENQEKNPFTERMVQTKRNFPLLEQNPVNASEDPASRYGKQQAALFSRFAKRDLAGMLTEIFNRDKDKTDIWFSRGASALIEKQFSQLYFYLLFSPEEGKLDKEKLANIANAFPDIQTLYHDIEAMTGKHDLSIGNLLGEDDHQPEQRDSTIISTFYRVVCQMYNQSMSDEMEQSSDQAKAAQIVALMKQHQASVLDVFDPQLIPSLENITDDEALLLCYNLLSWLDNSLNIANTLVNLISSISTKHPDFAHAEHREQFGILMSELPEQRALATMFMREVKQPITLRFGEDQFILNPGDRFMMTTGIKGCVFGNAPRKCPSTIFSPKVIIEFLKQFFSFFKVSAMENCPQDPQSRSWFWNKLDPTQLMIASQKNPVDLAECRKAFLLAFAENYKKLAGDSISTQIEQGKRAGLFSSHRQGVNLCIDILSRKEQNLSVQEAEQLMERLETLTHTAAYTHNKVSTRALLAIKESEENAHLFEENIDTAGQFQLRH